MITKRNLLIWSGAGSATLLILNQIGTYRLCGSNEYGLCMDNLSNVMLVFYPIIPLFIISLIVYFLRDEIFRAWIRFVYLWIPLSMFAILVAPEYGNAFLPIEKGTVAGFFSLLFIIVSIIIITIKHFLLKRRG